MSRPDLKSFSRWICWKIDPTNTQHKEPFDPHTNQHAACDDPTTWCDYKTAKAAVDAGRYDAIGFVLGKEVGLAIIDLDGCRNAETGEIDGWAAAEIETLNSCTEISYSQDGIHVLVHGEIPRNIKQTKNHVGVEMYDHDRMFALTGKFIDGHTKIEERDLSDLHRRVEAKSVGPMAPRPPLTAFAHNDIKFRKLCDADFVGWSGGPSEAVASVLVTLARLYNYDRDKMADEFEKTKLCELWESKEKGGKWTRLKEKELDRAIEFAKKNKSRSTAPVVEDIQFKFPKVPGQVCEYVLLPIRDRFDGLFGRGRVSLVGGSSGAGKTSLISELLFQQNHRRRFLGHLGAGLRPLTIFADRGRLSNMETLDRLGLLDAKLPMAHLSVCFDGGAVQGILDLIEAQDPLPEVVFVEGADALVSDAAKTQVVAPFLSAIQKIAEHYHIAIVLSVGAPKSKPREQHTLKRDRIFGSQIWPRMADTIVTLESVGDGTGGRRELTVQHRNSASEFFELEFRNGRLVERNVSADLDALDIWIAEREPDSWFTRGEAVKAMNDGQTGMKKTKVCDRIKDMLLRGVLQKQWNKERKIEEIRPREETPEQRAAREAFSGFDTKTVQ